MLRAKEDPEALEELVENTRFLLIGLYLAAAEETDSDDDIEAVQCTRCGEMTMYSGKMLLPKEDIPQMCLSKACISAAVQALSHMYEPQEQGAARPSNE